MYLIVDEKQLFRSLLSYKAMVEEGEVLDQPLSPSLLEEEAGQVVVEESDEEEEVVVGTPPPRLDDLLVPTSPIILTQRRVMRRRRGFGSENGPGASRQLQIGGAIEDSQGQDQQGVAGIQDHPLLSDEAGGRVEPIPEAAVHHVPAGHSREPPDAGISEEPPLLTDEEVQINDPTRGILDEDPGTAKGETQEKASTTTSKKAEARPRKKRKRVSEDEVKEHDNYNEEC